MKYIDIHSHIDFPDYDTDREAVITRARDAEIGIITVGTDLESSKRAIEVCEKYRPLHSDMWAIVGLHPTDAGKVTFDYDAFKKLALHPSVVAIGECGLDYFHAPFDVEHQRAVFIDQIRLSNETGKPLMLHVRNGKITDTTDNAGKVPSAYQDALALLKKHATVHDGMIRASFHFFAGTAKDLTDIIAAGCSVSFTGVVTFTRDYDERVKATPLHRIMSETDAPFVSPAPHRGQRNEPAYVSLVAEKIAEIRGENADAVRTALVKNAQQFFNI
jgi:TatD DNase family protein